MIEKPNEKSILVIASEKYESLFEKQVLEAGIERHFIFKPQDVSNYVYFTESFIKWHPIHIDYAQILNGRLEGCNRIVILGSNYFLKYLISEIAFQNGLESIYGVVDLDEEEKTTIMGINYMKVEDVGKADCLIINYRRNAQFKDSIGYREKIENTFKKKIIDIYDAYGINKSNEYEYLTKFKDLYRGKRVFLIGNGPSLKMTDLDKLHDSNSICFACNKIYLAFEKTDWRADYYFCADARCTKEMAISVPHDRFFCTQPFNPEFGIEYDYMPDDCLKLLCKNEAHFPNYPDFSLDVTKYVVGSGSVMYIMLQMAIYMGFSEIILLGVDHNYAGAEGHHFTEKYISETELFVNNFPEDEVARAYEKARMIAEEKGVVIYNASRKSKLNVFERIDFDTIEF